MVDTESLVPPEHLLRQVDAAVDFEKLYEIVEALYSEEEGRRSIDPVVLFKIVLLQHLDGNVSLRGTLRRAQTDIAYRWFLRYTLSEELPHFSTVSYNFRHRFTSETIEAVFRWILEEAGSAGALTPAAVFIDGTHIKASANLKKKMKQEVPAAAKRYQEELLAEVNADREAHGKKPLDDEEEPPKAGGKKQDNTSKKKQARRKKEAKKQKTVTVSTTDPESGMFQKGEHKRCFAYEAHTACDKSGYVLETVVTPGNVHDSVAFDDVYDKLIQSFPEVETVVADAAYKTPHICKKVFRDGRVLSTAYKRPTTMKGGHPWWSYVYDEYYDCVICPEYHILSYRTTNRDGYREYRSDPTICAQCPTRHLCTKSKSFVKTVLRHIWKGYEELADDARYTPEYKQLYARRKETIERVFADAKEKHAMRYTVYRGLAQVSNWVRLKFAAMNLKKLARWKARKRFAPPSSTPSSYILFLINVVACLVMKPDRAFFDKLCSAGISRRAFCLLYLRPISARNRLSKPAPHPGAVVIIKGEIPLTSRPRRSIWSSVVPSYPSASIWKS
ncbi:IS1182 family transposase ISBcl1 [Firmicutes bacterium ASF500]|nr:IS1182 family transposase ISBcl1 [Firmicutes bacterium ASF500]